jgi:hypothetical protein
MAAEHFLALDATDNPLFVFVWDTTDMMVVPEGCVRMIRYDGPFHPGGTWDNVNRVLVDPRPAPAPVAAASSTGAQEL